MTTELDQEMLADLAYLNLLQEMRDATERNTELVELETIWPSD